MAYNLMVTFKELDDVKNRIKTLAEHYEKDSNELGEIISLLEKCWSGEASEKYAKALCEIKQNSDGTVVVLSEMSKLLGNIIEIYSASEQAWVDSILEDE